MIKILFDLTNEEMRDTLHYRGPDEVGEYVEDNDECVAVGHARLIIIDPAGNNNKLNYSIYCFRDVG